MTHKEIYAELRKRTEEALAQTTRNVTTSELKLKLFTCRVIYTDQSARNSWFTVLDISKDAAHEAVQARVKKFTQLNGRRGHVSTVEVSEITGPFLAGQILHEER